MDIITHGLVGACIGAQYNAPITGALVAIAPDAVLGVKRKVLPTIPYKLTHSLLLCCVVGLGLYYGGLVSLLVFQAWLSHILIDLVTHGNDWAPRPLYPFSDRVFRLNIPEWEFFNSTWKFGLVLSLGIVLLCVL